MSTAEFAAERNLGRLSELWEPDVAPKYEDYFEAAELVDPSQRSKAALAAALVETALERHGIRAAEPGQVTDVLVGDLCLAKASRLLVETADPRLQVAFARAVERLASAPQRAAAATTDTREELRRALQVAS